MNTADYLLQNVDDHNFALIEKRGPSTYGDRKAASARILGELRGRGVSPNDRVAILADNSLFWAAAYLAILKLPAVAVFLPTVSTGEDIVRKLDFIAAQTLILDRKAHRKVAERISENIKLISNEVLDQPGESYWVSIQHRTF